MASSLSSIHCICKDTNSLIPLNYTQLSQVSELQANWRLNVNHFCKASISCNSFSRGKPSRYSIACKASTRRYFPCGHCHTAISSEGTKLLWAQSLLCWERGLQEGSVEQESTAWPALLGSPARVESERSLWVAATQHWEEHRFPENKPGED